MDLQRLEFTLTTKCNSQCIYCQADASPLKNEVMEVEDARNYLTETSSISTPESFLVFGGEPMLFSTRAIAVFEKAHQLGIPKIEMLTNGTWGRNRKNADELAVRLKHAGLNTLGISVDAFHQQFVPLEYVRNAGLASVQAGIEQVTWNVAVIESVKARNKYDKRTAQILKALKPTGIDAHIHEVVPIGRAATNLRRYLQRESFQGPCMGDPLLENALADPHCITIEPSGETNICWNLAIGNAKKKPLNQIIREYDWRKNPIVTTLVEDGPIGLLKDAKRQGFRFQRNRYLSKCHFCIGIRKAMNLLRT